MSNNEQIKKNPIEVIKEIPDYQKNNIAPLTAKVRDMKDKIRQAKEELTRRRLELTARKKEEEQLDALDTQEAAKEEVVETAAEVVAVVEEVPVAAPIVAEENTAPIIEEVKTESAAEVKPTRAPSQPKIYIPDNSELRTNNNGYSAQARPAANANGGYNNNNRPANTANGGCNNNNRPTNTANGGYNNNRPAGTGFNNGGYNNNRPAGTGFNNGGYNNNRPAGTGFNNGAPRTPRLPKPTDLIAPPMPPRDTVKKKKPNEEPKKQPLNKRTLVRKGYVNEGDFDENGEVRHIKQRRMKKQSSFTPNTVNIANAVVATREVPIKTLAERIGKTAIEIVKKCFDLEQMHTINDVIDFDTAELIASAFNITLEYKPDVTAEDTLNAIVQDGAEVKRPPVVTIMGHVDHGKTSLLDYIRKTRVASSEAGGITQHMGAYSIDVKGEKITFLDTPGHEAFTAMRMRGAKITDIAIIVVAADDGVMPQTIEAIRQCKEAGVSIMVAINKIDKPAANVDKIMQQLTQYEVMPEAWGGDVMVTPISAKTGQGVDDLLENIILLAEVKELTAIEDCPAKGNVIEARLDKGIGAVATVLIQNGTLRVGDYVVAGTSTGKVRALIDDKGKRIKEAKPSCAVSVLGFNEVPNAGDNLVVVEDEKLAKEVAQERLSKERLEMQSTSGRKNLEDMFKGMSDGDMKSLAVIIKGDVQGSVEAVKQALLKLNEDMASVGVKITILQANVGAITESDIRLADSSNSIVVAFNVRPEPKARALAEKSHVDIRTYRIIYDAIDDITKAMKGMLEPVYREEELGHAEVRNIFHITNVGTIAGCMVTDGKVARNAKFRLIRDNVVFFDGSISSLKRGKDEAKEVASGFECGIGLLNFNDILVGDIIEAFLLKEEEQI